MPRPRRQPLRWRCQSPAALKGVDLLLFNAFARVERVEVQVSGLARTSTGLARQRLQRGNPRLSIARAREQRAQDSLKWPMRCSSRSPCERSADEAVAS